MELTLEERETIIIFNEKEKTARLYTMNPKLKRQMDGLLKTRPDDVGLEYQNRDETFIIPKKWVKIRPSRILSQEQLDRLRVSAESLRINR